MNHLEIYLGRYNKIMSRKVLKGAVGKELCQEYRECEREEEDGIGKRL